MRSSTDVPEYLAIARVREVIAAESLFVCTARGSALDEVRLPLEGRLFLPARDRQDSRRRDAPGHSGGRTMAGPAGGPMVEEPGDWPENGPDEAPGSSPGRSIGNSLDDLAPSYMGPGAGRVVPVTITEKKTRPHHFVLRIQLHQPPGESLVGAWVLIPRAILDRTDGLYFYHIRHLPVCRRVGEVPVGRIVDYLETGASGVIVIETPVGAEVLVPFLDEFVTLDRAAGCALIPAFEDFR